MFYISFLKENINLLIKFFQLLNKLEPSFEYRKRKALVVNNDQTIEFVIPIKMVIFLRVSSACTNC